VEPISEHAKTISNLSHAILPKVKFQQSKEEPENAYQTNQIDKFKKREVISKLNDHRSSIQKNKEERDFAEMHNRIIKITKWDRFKIDRQNIIDEYIKVKRMQTRVKQQYAHIV